MDLVSLPGRSEERRRQGGPEERRQGGRIRGASGAAAQLKTRTWTSKVKLVEEALVRT